MLFSTKRPFYEFSNCGKKWTDILMIVWVVMFAAASV